MKRFSPLIACLLVAGPFIYYRKVAANPPNQVEVVAERFARSSGLSKETYIRLKRIQEKAIGRQPVSEDEWSQVEAASHAERSPFRCMTLEYLEKYVGTSYEERARALARRLAMDPDPGTRAFALLDLVSLRDPQAQPLIAEAEKSDQPYIREMAAKAGEKLAKKLGRDKRPI